MTASNNDEDTSIWQKRKEQRRKKNDIANQNERRFLLILSFFTAISLCLNIMDHKMTTDVISSDYDASLNAVSVDNFKMESQGIKVNATVASDNDGGGSASHSIGGLSCKKYGGPSDEIASEMVYWQEIPSDSTYQSPFYKKKKAGGRTQYLTFEPDGGGWNNIR